MKSGLIESITELVVEGGEGGRKAVGLEGRLREQNLLGREGEEVRSFLFVFVVVFSSPHSLFSEVVKSTNYVCV